MLGHLGMDLFVDQVRQRVGTSVFWTQGKGPTGKEKLDGFEKHASAS